MGQLFPSNLRIDILESSIGYEFKNKKLLMNACTHCSATINNNKNNENNQRMEFLGDAVLELCISEYLFVNYPDLSEGKMTKIRAGIVSEGALSQAAKKINLGAYLWMGKGEERTSGKDKPSILADAVEALIGAIYLDSGMVTAKAFVLSFLDSIIKDAVSVGGIRDYKTELQELSHRLGYPDCEYEITQESGPDHKKEFCARVSLSGNIMGQGIGSSKKSAQQQAAQMAIKQLKNKQ